MHPLSRFAPSPSRGTTPVAWQSQFHGVRWHRLLRGVSIGHTPRLNERREQCATR